MKCDELKRHHINEVMDMHNLTRGEMGYSVVYYAEDVDAAIAELKHKLEDVQASHYAESVDAGMRERRLRRALWLARAERAKSEKGFWVYKYNEDCGEFYYTIVSRSLASNEWMRVWENVERKCRSKAEEYK